jgi:hypothetical protein
MELLSMAWADASTAANEVGIDLDAMQQALPAPGTLMKGNQVRVLRREYRHTCSLLMHINRLPGGDQWPFLRFSTFKHGGMKCDFNGLRWWREVGARFGADSLPSHPSISLEAQERAASRRRQEATWRLPRFQRWHQRWSLAEPLHSAHSWVSDRLGWHADAALLGRVDLRYWPQVSGYTLMAPLENASGHAMGYQLLHADVGRPLVKRFCLPHEGASMGSFIRIRSCMSGGEPGCSPVAICEGLATGLSLALAWPGEIRVALTASNLAKVRHGVMGPCAFFCDEDIWKPHVGNVGRDKALAAMHADDMLHGPEFHPCSLLSQPTDYNDLLWLEGRGALNEQAGRAWMLWQQ